MSIVGSFENTLDRSGGGAIREAPEYTRSFTVRVDDPNTSILEIGNAPGIAYGDLHPDDPSTYVIKINVAAEGDSLLLYRVTFTYGIIEDEKVSGGAEASGGGSGGGGSTPPQPPDPLTLPIDTWSGAAGLYTSVSYTDVLGEIIANTADVPFPSGVSMDKVEGRLTLTRAYAIDSFDQMIEHFNCVNKVNSTEWPGIGAGSEIGWWRMSDASWNFRQQSSNGSTLSYYEATFTFAYRRGLTTKDINALGVDHIWWTSDIAQDQTAFGNTIPPWCKLIPSMGYQEKAPNNELVPITLPIEYKNCSGQPVQPPAGDPNSPCEWPTEERIAEPRGLDLFGRAIKAGDKPCVIVVNGIGPDGMADFADFFKSPRPSFLPPLTSP